MTLSLQLLLILCFFAVIALIDCIDSASMKFYLVPECPYEYNEINKNTVTFFDRLRNMTSLTSYQTTINNADYCLISYSCLWSSDVKAHIEYNCKKIVVIDLQPFVSRKLLRVISSGGPKYHVLFSNCRYVRNDIDICAPLFPKIICHPSDYNRRYSVSFKGTVYLSGEGMFRYQMKLLNQTPNSYIHFSCKTRTNIDNMYNHSVKSVSLDKECTQFNSSYFSTTDYCSTLNATFVLTPGGRQPSSYRFYDALSVGAIPIPYYDRHDVNVPLPYHRTVDWTRCTKIFTEIYDIERFILTDQERVRRRIDNCREIYNTHFGAMENIVSSWNKELSVVFSYTNITYSMYKFF